MLFEKYWGNFQRKVGSEFMWNSWWISPAAGPYWMPCIAAILMAKISSNSLKINAPFRLPKIKLLGSLSNGGSNEQRKSSRFRLAKPQLISLPLLHTTTTWTCLISCFVKDVNTGQQLSFSFPELQYSLFKFNSRKICQHLTNWTSWNKRDKVWSSVNSLFKWRFRSLCCYLSSLLLRRKRMNLLSLECSCAKWKAAF